MTTGRLAGYVNALSDDRARAALERCCGARQWVDAVLAARPFASDVELLAAAERIWWGLGRADWLEALAAHPRIGGRANTGWTRREQAGVDGAAGATRPRPERHQRSGREHAPRRREVVRRHVPAALRYGGVLRGPGDLAVPSVRRDRIRDW